ncbi:MAG: hypothetical protein LUG12_01975 [Erysipelotrichaceae bacterium]|nr:hypothetical protein [Erysipelotrichaceae bacterium]
MLCYYTLLHTTEEFNKDILIGMYLNWLQRTKNQMPNLHYQGEDDFYYTVPHKELIIKDFKDRGLNISFMTDDNEKLNRFTVEILYLDHILHLKFYKEITDQSIYIDKISIPGIFRDLFHSPYILQDDVFKISDKPYYLDQMIEMNTELPVIIIKGPRYRLNPEKLAYQLTGNAHIVCLNNCKSAIMIKYPHQSLKIFKSSYKESYSRLTYRLSDAVRSYCINQNHSNSYQQLYEMELQEKQKDFKQSTIEIKEYYENEIKEKQMMLEMLQEEYMEKCQLLDDVNKLNNELKNKSQLLNYEALLVNKEDNEEYRIYMMKLLEIALRNLDNDEIYRRKDIIESIVKMNKQVNV